MTKRNETNIKKTLPLIEEAGFFLLFQTISYFFIPLFSDCAVCLGALALSSSLHSPCFFIKTIHSELLWPPSETRRQPTPKEGWSERGKGQEETEGGRCLLGRALPGQTQAVLHPSIHLGLNLNCRGGGVRLKTAARGDRGIERQQRRAPSATHEAKC